MTEPRDPAESAAPKPRRRRAASPGGNGVAPAVAVADRVVEAPAGGETRAQPDPATTPEPVPPSEFALALSPKQILGGFALLAGLIILARRRGRGRKG